MDQSQIAEDEQEHSLELTAEAIVDAGSQARGLAWGLWGQVPVQLFIATCLQAAGHIAASPVLEGLGASSSMVPMLPLNQDAAEDSTGKGKGKGKTKNKGKIDNNEQQPKAKKAEE